MIIQMIFATGKQAGLQINRLDRPSLAREYKPEVDKKTIQNACLMVQFTV